MSGFMGTHNPRTHRLTATLSASRSLARRVNRLHVFMAVQGNRLTGWKRKRGTRGCPPVPELLVSTGLHFIDHKARKLVEGLAWAREDHVHHVSAILMQHDQRRGRIIVEFSITDRCHRFHV